MYTKDHMAQLMYIHWQSFFFPKERNGANNPSAMDSCTNPAFEPLIACIHVASVSLHFQCFGYTKNGARPEHWKSGMFHHGRACFAGYATKRPEWVSLV